MLDAGSVVVTLGGRYNGSAFSKFDQAVLGSGRKMNAFERGLSGATARGSRALHAMGTAAGIGAAGGVAALGVALVSSVKVAGEFDKQMRNVNSIAGLSEKQFQKLSGRVLNLSGKVAQSPKTLAAGLYDLVSSGFDANESMTILAASSKAATAGLTDTATSTKAVAAVLNAYRLPASQASAVTDVLFQTVNRGVLSFAELSQSIGDVLPFAASMGVNIKQVGAAISTMTKEGINAPETVTRLKNVIQSFIKPSEGMAKAIEETGASSGEALVKHKGLQGALEAVIKTTDGSKTAIAELFPNIRALGGALALTGNNAKSAHQDIAAFTNVTGATEKVFKEQSKSASMAADHLKAYWQQAQILVGGALLPILAAQAGKLAGALAGAAKDGSLQQFGRDLGHELENVIHFAGQVGPALLEIAHAGGDVVSAIAPLVSSVAQLIASADPGVLVAFAAGIGAFMVAETVVPIIYALGTAIGALVVAGRAEGLAGMVGVLASAANPVTALAAVVGVAAGAFVLLSGNEHSEADAAKAVTAAKKDEAAAIQAIHDVVLGAADAAFGAAHADDNLRQAKQHLGEVAAKYGKHSKEYTAALQAEREAALRDTAEHERLKTAKKSIADADDKARKSATEHVKTAKELLRTRTQLIAADLVSGKIDGQGAVNRSIDAWKRYNATVQRAARGTAEAAISQIQLTRVLNGAKLLTDAQAVSVAKLAHVYDDLPKQTQTKLSTTSGPALAQIGDLVGALHNVPKQQVVQILAKADSAKAQIAALTAAVNGVPPERVIQILSTASSERVKVAALKATIAGMPDRAVTQILANGALSERVKIAAFAAAARGVPPAAITRVLADGALGARGQVLTLGAAVDAVNGKTATTTVNNVVNTIFHTIGAIGKDTIGAIGKAITGHASGRPSGVREASLVGEGRDPREYVIDRNTGAGYVTQGPMLVALTPDQYVIPADDRQKGRAMGLFGALARDLGVEGYAKGKKPKPKPKAKPKGKDQPKGKVARKHRHIPGKLDALSIPLTDLEQKVTDARTKLDAARTVISSTPGQISSTQASIRDIQRRVAKTPAQKANKADDLKRAQHQLAKQKADLAKAKRDGAREKTALSNLSKELRAAKAYQARIDKQTDLANLAAQQMTIADNKDDQGAYDKAKGDRTAALKQLKHLLKSLTSKHIKPNSAYFRKVEGDINQNIIDQQDNDDAEMKVDDQPDVPDPEPMTKDEKARLSQIQADIALAALTPDLGDDTTHAKELVDFLGTVLGEVQADPGGRGGNDAITDIAGQLKTAQDNLTSLTTGSGTNDNADLQAQLDQEKQRRQTAEQNQQIAEGALAVYKGPGDIGAGPGTAGGAAAAPGVAPQIVINTLHPADPATLNAIGSAATAGMGLQGLRQSPRQKIGA